MTGDMHCHSTFSDSSCSVPALVDYALRAGLDFIALTDHDTMAGVRRAVSLGKRRGLQVIPGIEISCWDQERQRQAHLLCYWPRYPERLEQFTEKILSTRREATKNLLRAMEGCYPVTWEDVCRCAGESRSVYRQHILCALMEQGYRVSVFGDDYRTFFRGLPYEVPLPTPWEAAKMIRSCGGVASLAHPSQFDSFELVEELAREGLLQAVELSHPRNSPEDKERLERLVRKYWLVPLGGSDFHGYYNSSPCYLGMCPTPGEALEALRRVREELNR